MTGEAAKLIGVYPAVPESFVFAPDDESEFHRLQNEFFLGITDGLGYVTLNALNAFCHIRSRELLRENDVPIIGNETNDRVTELQVSARTVASAIKVRTDFNFIQGLFALYLTPEMEEKVKFRAD